MKQNKRNIAHRCTRKIGAITLSLCMLAAGFTTGGSLPAADGAAGDLLAFPGAVGGGKYATGGRGGEVYHVTNLNDSGAGSFRDAVSKSNRIVVFDVSGTIELASNVVCQSNITIAGQTAPGGSGITLKNYKLGLGGTNVICRFLSSRPGPYQATSSGNDALGGANGSNSILDHCSIGWASDEQWGLYSQNDNYTLQYSVIGPANSWGGHAKGVHGFGIMLGRSNVTYDHNLVIHCVSRNFRGKVPDQNAADFTNNVIYDWGYQTTYGTIGHVNYVNNTLKAGNSTTGAYHYAEVSNSENFKLFLTGNRILNKDNSVRNAENANWSAISYKSGKDEASTRSDVPFAITTNGEDVSTAMTAESAADSYNHVIAYAGNGISSDLRTAIDRQCAEETKNGTGSCSGTAAYDSSVSELDKYHITCGVTYEYPAPVLTKTITDADNDGMDDAWELLRGLNPNDASDTNGDYCGGGYTNIEYYINDLTVDAFPAGVVTPSPEIAATEPISAFTTIEAEDFASQSGVQIEDNGNGTVNVGYIENGDYIMFRNVDFEDGGKCFSANVASTAAGASVAVYVGSLNSTPVATLTVPDTGGWQNFTKVSCNMATVSGTKNIYLKFVGGDGYLCNIDSFVFGRDAIPMNGKLISNLFVLDETYFSAYSIGQNLADGAMIFGDRTFTFVNLPQELVGAEYIMTACDAKNLTTDLLTLTAAADMTLYVAQDGRVTTAPAWLSTWEKTDLTFQSSNDVSFTVYQTKLSAGENITLGQNGQAAGCINYSVMAVADTAQTTTEPIGALLKGDVNCDGDVKIGDVILLNRFLSEDTAVMISKQGLANADMNDSGAPESDDAVRILSILAGLS